VKVVGACVYLAQGSTVVEFKARAARQIVARSLAFGLRIHSERRFRGAVSSAFGAAAPRAVWVEHFLVHEGRLRLQVTEDASAGGGEDGTCCHTCACVLSMGVVWTAKFSAA
jgi:hypothetical protein